MYFTKFLRILKRISEAAFFGNGNRLVIMAEYRIAHLSNLIEVMGKELIELGNPNASSSAISH